MTTPRWHSALTRACDWLRIQKLRCEALAGAARERVVRATAEQRAQACGGTVVALERVLVTHDVALPGAPGGAARAWAGLLAGLASLHGALARVLVAHNGSEQALARRMSDLVAALRADGAPPSVIDSVAAVQPDVVAPWSAAEGEPTCER